MVERPVGKDGNTIIDIEIQRTTNRRGSLA